MMELEKLVHFSMPSLYLSVIKPIQHLVLPKSFRFSFFFSSTNTLRFREGISTFYLLQVRTNLFFGSRCVHPLSTTHPTHYNNTHTYTHTHISCRLLSALPPCTTLSFLTPSHPPSQPYPTFQHSICPDSNVQWFQSESLNTVRSFLIGDL